MTLSTDERVRRQIRVSGVVQGVGFRPFVYRLAIELSLAGEVGNDALGVFVDVEGSSSAVARFEERLVHDAPPLARIDDVVSSAEVFSGRSGFQIVESRDGGTVGTFVAPDVAVCDDCLRELFDSNDRRYRYPFINCTNCGPRFTITKHLPYDRPNTTMARFPLCPACLAEYRDPFDRRYHAQPVACATCGPRVWFEGSSDFIMETDASIAAAQQTLATGGIIAIKGIGGFHLACDATSSSAVDILRQRKGRSDKPFAVMVRDLMDATKLAQIDEHEARLLASAQRPIMLVRRREHSRLSPRVAPANPDLGVVLPYSPLHHLLFAPVPRFDAPVPDVLVMTSGNISDEPICYDNDDAQRRLGGLVDAWLLHDRPIHVPCDDSVLRVDGSTELPIRRSRGYAPLPLRLPFDTVPTLATGGELKNTFCIVSGRDAWMSQHIGDMGSVETLNAFERSVGQFRDLYEINPEQIASDAHPSYQTRRWAEQQSVSPVLVQHHHAHVAALMAEHGVAADEQIIGCAFDGTGYGTDGAIWGGEFLVAAYDGFERVAHLRYSPLPGGDAAVRKPYRSALAQLWAAGVEWTADLAPVRNTTPAELSVLRRQLERDVQCVPTSSMGRLFDAVSSLIGVRHVASYEAQAAIELEALAANCLDSARTYGFGINGSDIDSRPVLQQIVSDLRNDVGPGSIAAGFHLAVANMIADVSEKAAARYGLDRVGLTGGVFQNVTLVNLARVELANRDLRTLTHRLVPPNDGGLALGQSAITGYAALSTSRSL